MQGLLPTICRKSSESKNPVTVMGYGRRVAFGENPNRLSDLSATSNGFGWYLTAIPERLSGCMLDADAEALWKSLPPVYRQCAVCYTDFWSAYEQILPQNRHRAVGKESGKTNRIERSNLTLRQ